MSPAPVYNYLLSYRGSLTFNIFFAAGDEEAAKVRYDLIGLVWENMSQKWSYNYLSYHENI